MPNTHCRDILTCPCLPFPVKQYIYLPVLNKTSLGNFLYKKDSLFTAALKFSYLVDDKSNVGGASRLLSSQFELCTTFNLAIKSTTAIEEANILLEWTQNCGPAWLLGVLHCKTSNLSDSLSSFTKPDSSNFIASMLTALDCGKVCNPRDASESRFAHAVHATID